MKTEEILWHLKELAEKLNITVLEHSFRNSGVPVESGYCRIKGEAFFILDKHAKLTHKRTILAKFLARQPLENIYLLPVLREELNQYGTDSD